MYAIRITMMSGPDDGLEIWLKDNEQKGHAIKDGWEFIIGRHKESDLNIPFDTQISRKHAFLRIIIGKDLSISTAYPQAKPEMSQPLIKSGPK